MDNAAATVLVVDDDEDIAMLMRDFLESAGYRVLVATNGQNALEIIHRSSVDCMLLDVMMPGLSGFDVIRKIREPHEIPVLFLSAKHEDSDKLRGLGLGADDYIVKSATPAEVVARVKAVLRRTRRPIESARTILDFGRIVIDIEAREVRKEGQSVSLTAREFDLIRLLAESPRQVFSRDHLFERLWGAYGDRHTVTVHIGRLREKLEVDPAKPELIVTIWGVGYRFEGQRRS